MDKDIKKNLSKAEDKIRFKLARKLAQVIESSLESFGIVCRVVEFNFRPNDIEYCLELVLGTSVEEVIKHKKDIAMAVASPTGEVEIEAPIPGRSLFAIRIPLKDEWMKSQYEYHNNQEKLIKETTQKAQNIETEFPKTFREYFAMVFYIIQGILDITSVFLRKLGNFIEGKEH